MKIPTRGAILSGAGLMAPFVLGAPFYAQAAVEAPAHSVEEITVTATRRATNLQETPAAVSAFDSEMLENASASSLSELSANIPNTEFVKSGSSFLGYIRGVGNSNAGLTGDQNLAFYIDGVYIEKGYGADMDLADVERVEILRGPQGTLYGRNATAGAVNIVLREPGDAFDASAAASVGNYNARRVDVTLGGPVNEQLGARLTLARSDHDGYITNIAGPDAQDENLSSARGILVFSPSNDVRLRLTADYSKARDHGIGSKLGSDQGDIGALASGVFGITGEGLVPSDFWTLANDNSIEQQVEIWGVTAHANIDLSPNLAVTSITAYRSFDRAVDRDVDATQAPILGLTLPVEAVDQVSQEFQLHGQWGRFDWVGGAFYYDMDSRIETALIQGGVPDPYEQINQSTEAWALFSDVIFQLTNRFAIQGGIRYSNERKTINDNAGFALSDEWSDVSPKIGVNYQLSDDVLLFASVADGFKSGGFNEGNVGANVSAVVSPENLRSYELGAKTEWFDRRLRLNITGFQYDYDDLQAQSFVIADGEPVQILTNAARSVTRGIEVEFDAQPTEALSLNGFVSYLDAEYRSFPNAVISGSGAIGDVSGNTMPYAPEWKWGFGAQYKRRLGTGGALTFGENYTWTGEHFYDEFNSPGTFEEAHGSLSAYVRYTSPDEHWRAEIYGSNLTDEKIAFSRTAPFGPADPIINPGAPLTYGFRLRYTY